MAAPIGIGIAIPQYVETKGSGAAAGPQSVVPVGLLLAITRPLNASSFTEPMSDEELLLLL